MALTLRAGRRWLIGLAATTAIISLASLILDTMFTPSAKKIRKLDSESLMVTQIGMHND